MNRYALRLILAFAVLGPALTSTGAMAEDAPVFSPKDEPFGKTYSEWAAAWWVWAGSQPASTNPILDPDGTFCTNNQEGNVWFLAGTNGKPEMKGITRHCTVPPHTALLFPVINRLSCKIRKTNPPKDALEQQTEESAHGPRGCRISHLASGLHATIGKVSVPDINPYCENSAKFELVLPEGNIFGNPPPLPAGTVLDPCRDSGYYLMVRPLSPGDHIRIQFGGTLASPPGFEVDVTYEIDVSM